MAEPLRRVDDFKLDEFPETPNMDVAPPPAPFGANDRGDMLMHSDEVDISRDPDHLLEAHDPERERQWPLGRIPQASSSLAARLKTTAANWTNTLRDYGEEWRDRAADTADSISHSSSRLTDRFQNNLVEWRGRANDIACDLKQRSTDRAQDLRARTEQLVNERPAQALAIVAGIGFALGVALRVGRSRREH
jgi:ElaB/YqjD/DUF883 family membrane-anchored ribosome-binding protein